MSAAPQEPGLETEDVARAQWYALVSRLFYAAPDRALLDQLGAAGEPSGDGADAPLAVAWRALQAACREADPEAVQAEFEALFAGVGKALVTPYTSAYAAPHAPDRHLLALRDRFREWGLARQHGVFETEDHLSAVCDGMRWLIEHGRSLTEQRDYFMLYINGAIPAFCTAINQAAGAQFYLSVGALTASFHAVEKDAFDMHSET